VNIAEKIVMCPVGALVPYASNSRTHTPEEIAKIAKSIESFGWTNPILVDGENGILAGHARLEAAQQLGLACVDAPLAACSAPFCCSTEIQQRPGKVGEPQVKGFVAPNRMQSAPCEGLEDFIKGRVNGLSSSVVPPYEKLRFQLHTFIVGEIQRLQLIDHLTSPSCARTILWLGEIAAVRFGTSELIRRLANTRRR
jgi:hypothetical protein